MPTPKKTTTKPAAKKAVKKVKWDEVESVTPVTTEKPAVAPAIDENTVPFGGRTKVEQIIREYRKHVKKSPIPKNGVAKAPDGTQYNYFLTEDVLDHADDFCEGKGAFLQSWMEVVDGNNVMKLTLEHIDSGHAKQVSADLGRPSSMSDFGGRITYSPKYLVAILFGISIQTDTDAYHNGTVKNDNQINNAKDKPVTGGEATKTKATGAKVPTGDVPSVPDSGSGNSTSSPDNGNSKSGSDAKVDAVESASFIAARAFIGKAYSEVMLSEAETKLANSQKLSDDEKGALASMIAEKREELAK